MKIEFRKAPLQQSKFEFEQNSVKFLGTFSKISSKIVKLDANISGECQVDCCKCGQSFSKHIDEKLECLLSDGIYSSNIDEELVIIEVEDHIIDFSNILNSELESFKSDYHICDDCQNSNDLIELEY
jgi:hypothetical protein